MKKLVIILMLGMPFMVGCFGKSGVNPVADTSLSQQNQEISALPVSQTPQFLGAKFLAPSKKKYSFAEPPHKIVQRLRAGLEKTPGCLKISLQSASKSDHIFLTLSDMKVKNQSGQISIPLPSQQIDLLSSDLNDLLSNAKLAPGRYEQMTFKISNAKIVLNGETKDMIVPSNKVKFLGSFEIKDGFRTELTIKFLNKLVKVWTPSKGNTFMFLPVVKISSKLVEIFTPPPAVVDGDISGVAVDYVKKTPLSGISVTLAGTAFSATTDSTGKFGFSKVGQGDYNLGFKNADYLDKSFAVKVVAGQISEVNVEMNPAVIKSTVANTGWFSLEYPLADANGQYGEVAMETPVVVDFSSLAFTKAEVVFDAEYFRTSTGIFDSYISATKQVQVLTDLGTWWVGNNATLGMFLGERTSSSPATHYVIDVTDFIRNNPNGFYFFASRNLSVANMRLLNIQLSIFYR